MPQDDAGFTLAEVIVSITIFVIMATSASYAIWGLIKTTRATQNRVVATNLARQEVERMRLQAGTARQLDSAPQTVTLKGHTYTVTPTMTPPANDPTSPCDTGQFRSVTVTVAWSGSGGQTVRLDTELAC
ncbi:MAG TPA: prepilin-type N-terminal cleavage/methylation domain-containing protein [Jatrophihabitans sp.]|nr:prepilin-type N-terminal cleavage/methylation domain-containing protein [Jatrophihabitans sp.]